jgi:hypothetical protein
MFVQKGKLLLLPKYSAPACSMRDWVLFIWSSFICNCKLIFSQYLLNRLYTFVVGNSASLNIFITDWLRRCTHILLLRFGDMQVLELCLLVFVFENQWGLGLIQKSLCIDTLKWGVGSCGKYSSSSSIVLVRVFGRRGVSFMWVFYVGSQTN